MRHLLISLALLPLLACGGPAGEPLGSARSGRFGDPTPNPNPRPVIPAPAITSLSPASGYPGTLVTLTGTNFQNAGLFGPYAIRLSSSSVVTLSSATYLSPTQITFVVPNLSLPSAQIFAVDIFQTGGAFPNTVRASSPTGFTYVAPADLSLVNSSQGQISSLSVDGALVSNLAIPPGASQPVTVPAGQHLFTADVDVNGLGHAVVPSSVTFTAAFGAANMLAIPRLTVGQLLANGGRVINGVQRRSWVGMDGANSVALIFFANGQWQHLFNGIQDGAGTLTELSWPNLASSIDVGLEPGHSFTLSDPFTSFIAVGVTFRRV